MYSTTQCMPYHIMHVCPVYLRVSNVRGIGGVGAQHNVTDQENEIRQQQHNPWHVLQ